MLLHNITASTPSASSASWLLLLWVRIFGFFGGCHAKCPGLFIPPDFRDPAIRITFTHFFVPIGVICHTDVVDPDQLQETMHNGALIR